jgi:hypothetical protein
MPLSTTPPQSLTDSLIALKTQYERSLTEATTNTSHLREQLSHVNALLLNLLLPTTAPQAAHVKAEVPAAKAIAQATATPATALAPVAPKTKDSIRKTKTESQPVSGGITPREMLPTYQGLKRLEAIAQVLAATPDEEVTADSIVQTLFGALSTAEHKAERKRMNALLYQGVQKGLWKKGSELSRFVIPNSTATTKAPTPAKPTAQPQPKPTPTPAKSYKSLEVLPAYRGVSKRKAIAQILEQHSGEVLHQDTIIQTLYGDLSPEDLKKERVRTDTSLRNGVKANKWKKASVPASYVLEVIAPVPAAKARAAKPKLERKPSVKAEAKAKAQRKKTTPTQKELLDALRKADIEI